MRVRFVIETLYRYVIAMALYCSIDGNTLNAGSSFDDLADDRGLAYGHGLFETILYKDGKNLPVKQASRANLSRCAKNWDFCRLQTTLPRAHL